jgi:hypothetical protein
MYKKANKMVEPVGVEPTRINGLKDRCPSTVALVPYKIFNESVSSTLL